MKALRILTFTVLCTLCLCYRLPFMQYDCNNPVRVNPPCNPYFGRNILHELRHDISIYFHRIMNLLDQILNSINDLKFIHDKDETLNEMPGKKIGEDETGVKTDYSMFDYHYADSTALKKYHNTGRGSNNNPSYERKPFETYRKSDENSDFNLDSLPHLSTENEHLKDDLTENTIKSSETFDNDDTDENLSDMHDDDIYNDHQYHSENVNNSDSDVTTKNMKPSTVDFPWINRTINSSTSSYDDLIYVLDIVDLFKDPLANTILRQKLSDYITEKAGPHEFLSSEYDVTTTNMQYREHKDPSSYDRDYSWIDRAIKALPLDSPSDISAFLELIDTFKKDPLEETKYRERLLEFKLALDELDEVEE